jgi:hypothetical protein
LLSLAVESGTKVFVSNEGEAWATRKGLTYRLRSKEFRAWLINEFYKQHRQFSTSDVLEVVLGLLESRARTKGTSRPVFLRVGRDASGALWLDLGRPKSAAAVKLTADGWTVEKKPGVHFYRARGSHPIPEPERGGWLAAMRRLLNLRGERDWQLAVVWCIAAMRPDVPQPILVLQGEQGSAKTTTARLLRRLIDPATPEVRAFPRKEDDLLVAAKGRWVLAFDNLSGLPAGQSDALCRLSTGGGLGKRELYTDSDESLLDARRPVILNGIDDLLSRGDLASRSIVLDLPTIPESSRRTEAEVLAEFDAIHAQVLGALCDSVCAALRHESATRGRLRRLPRLADVVVWASAAEPALGWAAGTVQHAMENLAEEVASDSLERDDVGAAVAKLMLERNSWTGTTTELKAALEGGRGTFPSSWPRSTRSLTNAMKRAAPALRARGIVWKRGPSQGDGQLWILTTVSTLSTISAAPEAAKRTDGTDGTGGASFQQHGEECV